VNGWIGVDLDGTLAEHYWPQDGPFEFNRIGAPVPRMVARVKSWLAEGKDVRIFTARADGGEVAIAMGASMGEHFRDVDRIVAIIQAWTLEHIGVKLSVTNKKDYGMIELWDDRAYRVIMNQGVRCCTHCESY